ncbi:MAG: hypothetical protein ABEJ22_08505 [Haloferacaceae archaeon]
MERLTRRGLVQSAGALSVAALAGCSALSEDRASTTATPEYDRLRRTATYRSDDVGLRLPEEVPRVEAPSNADLLVVHGKPAVDAERAVAWLADGRVIALLGDGAQRTWTGWTGSDEYRDAFDARARSESDPAPHLLVAAAKGTAVTTSRFSWGDLPSNRELLRSLEEALGDVATWTPD